MTLHGFMVPVSSDVKNLGGTLDSALSLNEHIGLVSKVYGLSNTGKSQTDDFAKSIACAIVGSRLDYANAVLVGVSASDIKKL